MVGKVGVAAWGCLGATAMATATAMAAATAVQVDHWEMVLKVETMETVAVVCEEADRVGEAALVVTVMAEMKVDK